MCLVDFPEVDKSALSFLKILERGRMDDLRLLRERDTLRALSRLRLQRELREVVEESNSPF